MHELMHTYVSWQAPGDSIVRANFEPLWLTMGTLNVKVGALAMAAPASSLLAAQLPPGRLPARLSAGLRPLAGFDAFVSSALPCIIMPIIFFSAVRIAITNMVGRRWMDTWCAASHTHGTHPAGRRRDPPF